MGVNQSTVQRFLAGRTKNVTEAIVPLLNYAGIEVNSRIDEEEHSPSSAGHLRIQQALKKVWDGDDASAMAIAQVIEAVGPFLRNWRGEEPQK